MNDETLRNFNGSYVCDFNLNKQYKNVIGFRLDKAIYENIDRNLNGPQTNIYLDVIINNIPREACMNNLKGYNIVKRLPYEYSYSTSNGSGVEYAALYSKPNYFYPINLDQLSLSLKYNRKEASIKLINTINKASPVVITTSTPHKLMDKSKIIFTDIIGMIEINNNIYYSKIVNDTTFNIYEDEALTSQVDSSTYGIFSSGKVNTVLTDLIDLKSINTKNFDSTNIVSGLKFSFEFELTLLNR